MCFSLKLILNQLFTVGRYNNNTNIFKYKNISGKQCVTTAAW